MAFGEDGYVIVGDKLVWGDVNESGIVETSDITRLAMHLAEIPDKGLTGKGYILADVTRDNAVNLADLILLVQYLSSEDLNNPDVVLGIPR